MKSEPIDKAEKNNTDGDLKISPRVVELSGIIQLPESTDVKRFREEYLEKKYLKKDLR